jgi:hypothetical protein
MIRINSVFTATGLLLAFGASLAASDAQAVDAPRILSANATSYCQTALPVFDGQIRKRPLAVQNEGTSNAFVTCSFNRHWNSNAATEIDMYAQNNASVAQSLTCTLVAGIATGTSNQYVSKTVSLPAGGAQVIMTWLPADFSGGVFPDTQYSMSCNLLPGVGLNDSYVSFVEFVGA